MKEIIFRTLIKLERFTKTRFFKYSFTFGLGFLTAIILLALWK